VRKEYDHWSVGAQAETTRNANIVQPVFEVDGMNFTE
jgi:hypothetical protein